jgi:hypothetical protein
LEHANLVKLHASKKRWIEAFMELGWLQHQVSMYLEDHPEQKDEALLITLGGWLQGGSCVTSLMKDHYDPKTSNILREPRLVAVMVEFANQMRPEYKKDPTVAEVLAFLPKAQSKINVPLHAPIPREDVDYLNKEFTRLVDLISAPAK